MNDIPLVHIENVSYSYGSGIVLEDISMDIHRGDFVGLIGPNGSGKTTLLKIIVGLLKPTQGVVKLFDQDRKEFSQWSKIGYVHQRVGMTSFPFPITVEEVVSLGTPYSNTLIGIELTPNPDSITHALEAVGMENFRSKLLRELSGGQQQRVFIAKALASQPELLILDEPTVGVDVDSQAKFYELLQKLNSHHKLTLILVSHDIDVVAHEVKTVACINKSLVFHGKPVDALQSNFMEKLYGKNIRYVVHGH